MTKCNVATTCKCTCDGTSATCNKVLLAEALPAVRELAADLAAGLGLVVLPGETVDPGVEALIPIGLPLSAGTGYLEERKLQAVVKDGVVQTRLLGGFGEVGA